MPSHVSRGTFIARAASAQCMSSKAPTAAARRCGSGGSPSASVTFWTSRRRCWVAAREVGPFGFPALPSAALPDAVQPGIVHDAEQPREGRCRAPKGHRRRRHGRASPARDPRLRTVAGEHQRITPLASDVGGELGTEGGHVWDSLNTHFDAPRSPTSRCAGAARGARTRASVKWAAAPNVSRKAPRGIERWLEPCHRTGACPGRAGRTRGSRRRLGLVGVHAPWKLLRHGAALATGDGASRGVLTHADAKTTVAAVSSLHSSELYPPRRTAAAGPSPAPHHGTMLI